MSSIASAYFAAALLTFSAALLVINGEAANAELKLAAAAGTAASSGAALLGLLETPVEAAASIVAPH